MHMYQDYAIKTYLLFLVGTTILSGKNKNYVDVTFLQYFWDLEMVKTYSWGLVALTFLYWELSIASIPKMEYFASYLKLLQPLIYHNVSDIG
ncbi:hypothetical protein L195_g032827 [Trifolium pratense]|uniref:Aminotransferase-like plant mobile domain-containing protein n=1 Tax=Trifolium pratense TaxID=57577 RepID=A0A2K3LE98_TRIPR|nr:hypothetical protein L195_g032827 [Trifolium pratense]